MPFFPCPCAQIPVLAPDAPHPCDDKSIYFNKISLILTRFEGVSPYFQIILDQEGGVDTLQVRVEISDSIPSLDEVKAIETLRADVARRIKDVLDVEAKVILVEPKSLRQLANGTGQILDRRPG